MASTNKLPNTGLNQWLNTDRPVMEDFNRDNQILDAMAGHLKKTPYIGADGFWYVWNTTTGEYVTTSRKATGETGPQGQKGDIGPQGATGAQGKPGKDGGAQADQSGNALNALKLGGQPSEYYAQKAKCYSATLTTTGWTATAPYTQTVVAAGIIVTDMPDISPVYSEPAATAMLEQKAWNMVSKAKPTENSITFTCFKKKPTTEISLQIRVVR